MPFIAFEGGEGSSKSTQAKLLYKWLLEKNINCLLTKEPGSNHSKICPQIRQFILNPENKMSSMTELFLYLADRAEHVESVIKPLVMDDKWVITDRYILSSLVYQGIGRGLGIERIKSAVYLAADDLIPDLTFILDVPVHIGLERAKKNNKEFIGGDRIEQEDFDFHNKLREGFLNIGGPGLIEIVDANDTIENIHKKIIKTILTTFEV